MLSVHPNLEPKFKLAFPALSCRHGGTGSLLLLLVEAEVYTSRAALPFFFFFFAPTKPNGKISDSRHSKLKHGSGRNTYKKVFIIVSCFLWNRNGFNINLYACYVKDLYVKCW